MILAWYRMTARRNSSNNNVRNNGVQLERRFSVTVGAKDLANVCTHCDQSTDELVQCTSIPSMTDLTCTI